MFVPEMLSHPTSWLFDFLFSFFFCDGDDKKKDQKDKKDESEWSDQRLRTEYLRRIAYIVAVTQTCRERTWTLFSPL